MTFRVTGASECPSGKHVTLTVLINGSQERSFIVGYDTIKTEGDEVPDVTKAFLRLNSAIKEAGANTKQEIAAAIMNIDFQV